MAGVWVWQRGGGEAEEGGDEDEEDMGDIDYEDPDFDNDSVRHTGAQGGSARAAIGTVV